MGSAGRAFKAEIRQHLVRLPTGTAFQRDRVGEAGEDRALTLTLATYRELVQGVKLYVECETSSGSEVNGLSSSDAFVPLTETI